MDHVDRIIAATEHAKKLGTFEAADRSKQYTRVDNAELLRAVNEAWTKIRSLEKANASKDQDLAQLRTQLKRYRVANIALTSILTGLAWEGVKALVSWMAHPPHFLF